MKFIVAVWSLLCKQTNQEVVLHLSCVLFQQWFKFSHTSAALEWLFPKHFLYKTFILFSSDRAEWRKMDNKKFVFDVVNELCRVKRPLTSYDPLINSSASLKFRNYFHSVISPFSNSHFITEWWKGRGKLWVKEKSFTCVHAPVPLLETDP